MSDGAQMCPIVTEIEDIHELLARTQARELDTPEILGLLTLDLPVRIGDAKTRPVSQSELLKVGTVPASEGVVNSIGELLKGVGTRRSENAPRPGPEVLAVTLDEIDPDRQPRARHGYSAPGALISCSRAVVILTLEDASIHDHSIATAISSRCRAGWVSTFVARRRGRNRSTLFVW